MAVAKIGNYSFITIRGALQGVAETLEEITRPGVDGQAYRKAGKRGPIFRLFPIVDMTSAANAAALVVNMQALVGANPVTIYDDNGQSLQNAKILDVAHVRTARVETPVGGINGGNFLVELRVQAQATQ